MKDFKNFLVNENKQSNNTRLKRLLKQVAREGDYDYSQMRKSIDAWFEDEKFTDEDIFNILDVINAIYMGDDSSKYVELANEYQDKEGY